MRPLSTTPPCQIIARRRVRLLGGVTVPAVVLGAVLSANPALAATELTKSDLTSAFGLATTAGTTFTLSNDLVGSDGSYDRQTLGDGKKLTIDLKGHELDLDEIDVGDGSTLIITDTAAAPGAGLDVGRASLPAKGATGISLGDAASLTITDAKVSIEGGDSAAGIATSAADSSRIALAGHTDLTASGAKGAIALGRDVAAAADALSIAPGSTLHVPADNTLSGGSGSTVGNAGLIDLQGTLSGTVKNDGTIKQGSSSSIAGSTITGNNFLVSYDKGTAQGEVPAPVRVLAKDLASVTLALAPGVTSAGQYFDGWTTDAAQGAALTPLSTLKDYANQLGEVVLRPILRDRVVTTTGPLAVATVGRSYSADVKVAKGYGVSTYALADGSALPDGLTLAADGTISGTAEAATDGPQAFTVVVTAQQDTTVTKEQTYSISVGKATTLTTKSLDPVLQNSTFSTTLSADATGPVTYAMAKGTVLPAGLQLDSATGVISGKPTKEGAFTFSVKASSATYQGAPGDKDVADYSLTVQSVPVFTATKVKSAPVGTDYVGSVKATDADSTAAETTVTYAITDQGSLPSDFALTTDGSLKGRAAVIGDYSFTVTAKGVHGSSTQVYSLSVGAVPVITSQAALPEVTVGATGYSQQLSATGKGVVFSAKNLPNGMALSGDGHGVLTGAPSASSTGRTGGVYTFTVTATNEYGSVDQVFSLRAGTKPVISTTSLLDVGVGQPYRGSVSFTSDGAATVEVTGLPEGLSYDADEHEISGSTTKNGSFPVTVAVTNRWGTTTSAPLTLVVGTAPADFADTLPTMVIGNEVAQALGAKGEGAITYSITAGSLPNGVELDGDTVTGTPTKAGPYSVTIAATTKYGSTSKTYAGVAGAAPTFEETDAAPTGFIGQVYASTQLVITGDGDAVYALAKGDTLPTGLTLSKTGLISGTPTGAGSTFSVVVTTPFGTATSAPVQITTRQPAVFVTDGFKPVVLDSGKGVVDQVISAEGDGELVSVAPKGDLPAGLFFDKGRNALYGTVKKAGTIRLTFTATGVGAPTLRTYDLEVGAAPVVATTALAGGQEGEEYASPILLGSGDGAITWTSTGDLPDGIALGEDGVLSGVPTSTGTSTFTVTATSAFGTSTSGELSLKVAAKPVVVVPTPDPVKTTAPIPVKTQEPTPAKVEAPAPVKVETPAPVKTTTPAPIQTAAPAPVQTVAPAPVVAAPAPAMPTLPDTVARFGHRLAISVAANSATAVTYSVSAGSLPAGLALDAATGVISGTPAGTGSYTATIKATNAAGSSETKLSITIPKIVELVQAKPEASTARIGKPVAVKISSLKKGEGFVVRVDGKVRLKGVAKKTGDVTVSVKLPRSLRDKVHTVSVTGDRTVSDPAKRAKTAFTVSTITLRKSLTVKAGEGSATVSHLAAGEAVKVTTSNGDVVVKGKADRSGAFTFSTKGLRKGTHRLTAHGATDLRVGALKVKIG